MNLKFLYVKDRGHLRTERLVLKVLADDDIGRYAIFRTLYRDASVTTGVTHAFWFPEKAVAAGDFIVLYTKQGNESAKISERGVTSHFFYWFETEPLWADRDYAAVALHAPDWISLAPDQE